MKILFVHIRSVRIRFCGILADVMFQIAFSYILIKIIPQTMPPQDQYRTEFSEELAEVLL